MVPNTPNPGPGFGHIESPSEKPKSIKEKLKKLKADVEKMETIRGKAEGLSDAAKKKEQIEELHKRARAVRQTIEQKTAEWERYYSHSPDALKEIKEFRKDLIKRIETILTLDEGKLNELKNELNDLKDDVEKNETDADELIETLKKVTMSKETEDALTEKEIKEQEGSFWNKLKKMAKPLMKLWITFQKGMAKMFKGVPFFKAEDLQANVDSAHETYDTFYGADELKDMFNKEFKNIKLEVQSGKDDVVMGAKNALEGAVGAFRALERKPENLNKTREELVAELAKEYKKEIFKAPADPNQEYRITLSGILGGRKAIEK